MNFLKYYQVDYEVPWSGNDMIFIKDRAGNELTIHPFFLSIGYIVVHAYISQEVKADYTRPRNFTTGQELLDQLKASNVDIHDPNNVAHAIARLACIIDVMQSQTNTDASWTR